MPFGPVLQYSILLYSTTVSTVIELPRVHVFTVLNYTRHILNMTELHESEDTIAVWPRQACVPYLQSASRKQPTSAVKFSQCGLLVFACRFIYSSHQVIDAAFFLKISVGHLTLETRASLLPDMGSVLSNLTW